MADVIGDLKKRSQTLKSRDGMSKSDGRDRRHPEGSQADGPRED
jgi:hypothetical protein